MWLVPQVLYLHDISFDWLGGLFSRNTIMHLAIVYLVGTLLIWFISVLNESAMGFHTRKVQHGLRLGFVLFIVSEIMLFFAFF